LCLRASKYSTEEQPCGTDAAVHLLRYTCCGTTSAERQRVVVEGCGTGRHWRAVLCSPDRNSRCHSSPPAAILSFACQQHRNPEAG
jgi:hypothetical protein